jgi:hypothetical protein
MSGDAAGRPARPAPWPAAVLVAIFIAVAVPIILGGTLAGRPGWDHYNYHEPMIRSLAGTWPRGDCSNYLSATTPLYHWTLAGVARHVSDALPVLRLAGALFTAGLLGLLAWGCVRALPDRPASAFVLTLPFAASLYVFPPGCWLLPDNAGWLGVLGVWLIALRPAQGARVLVAGGAVLLLLVLTRQIHIWTAALVWTAAWLGREAVLEPERSWLIPPALLKPTRERVARALAAFAITLPAFGVVGLFAVLWGGMVVPRYQGLYHGWGPSTPAFALSLLGVYSAFYAGWLAPRLAEAWHHHRSALLLGAAIGFAAAILPDTTYDLEGGRFGGLWKVAEQAPVLAGRTSSAILVLSAVGGVTLVLWLAAMGLRERVIFLVAFVAFEAAQTANPQVWQRYQEPFLLMFVALAASRTAPRGRLSGPVRAAMIGGPALLALAFASLTASTLAGSDDARTAPRDPRTSPHYRGPPQAAPPVYTEEPIPGDPP